MKKAKSSLKRSYRHRRKSNYVFKLPFGEEINSGTGGRTSGQGYGGADSIRQKFTGYERDGESALDYAKARYYSYGYGKFLNPDPLRSSATPNLPQSWNRYTYVLANPLILTDPDGLKWGYYMDGNKRYFRWFEGNVGKAGGHKYKEWTGSDVLDFKGLGRIRLGEDGKVFSVRMSQGRPAPASALANPQVRALTNAVTQHPQYRAAEKALNPDGVSVSFQTPGINFGGSLSLTKQFDLIWAPSGGRDFTSFGALANARSFTDVLNGRSLASGIGFNASWITEMDVDRRDTVAFFTGPSVTATGCFRICLGGTVVPDSVKPARYSLNLGLTPARVSGGPSYSSGYYLTNLHGLPPPEE